MNDDGIGPINCMWCFKFTEGEARFCCDECECQWRDAAEAEIQEPTKEQAA